MIEIKSVMSSPTTATPACWLSPRASR